MAYGSPDGEGGFEAYYTHIRGGRPPSAEALAELRGRYRAVGGSPLTEITRAQARALADRIEMPVFAGMKHAPPFIADAAAEARADGIERLVGLPLAPHYAEMSVGAYFTALRQAWDGELILVRGFHDHPAFVAAVRALLDEALARSGVRKALVCPSGFVADHLEILYDIDVEAMTFARDHGIVLRRTHSFNARPEFIDALAAVVRDAVNADSRPQGARIMES